MLATEKRLIYADDLKARFLVVAQSGGPVVVHVSDICKAIEDAAVYESVDAVEVVRCKDCEFWNDGWFPACTMGKCKRGKPVLTEPHHYCSYGVRRLDVPVIIKDESFIVKEETEK